MRSFEPVTETFFLTRLRFRNFAQFAKKHSESTHSARNVTEAQRNAVARLFNSHLGPDGANLTQQVRVDLLRKPG